MAYKCAKTGPFVLEKIITNDPTYLKLVFSDLNQVTNQKNTRQLSKGGRWPESFAIFLEEKANELLGKEVYVITSQTTREWDTTQWLSDIEPKEIGVSISYKDKAFFIASYSIGSPNLVPLP